MFVDFKIYSEKDPAKLKEELRKNDSPLRYKKVSSILSNFPKFTRDSIYRFSHKNLGFLFDLYKPLAELDESIFSSVENELNLNTQSIISGKSIPLEERLTNEEDFLDNPSEEKDNLLKSYRDIMQYLNQKNISCYLGMSNFISTELIIGKNPGGGNEFIYDPNNYLQKLKSIKS